MPNVSVPNRNHELQNHTELFHHCDFKLGSGHLAGPGRGSTGATAYVLSESKATK